MSTSRAHIDTATSKTSPVATFCGAETR
jgi:hypothetical protein